MKKTLLRASILLVYLIVFGPKSTSYAETLVPATENLASGEHVENSKFINEYDVVFQVFTVSGTVTDENGESLPGVNILLDGTTVGTVTDVAGEYRLEIPDGNGTLVFFPALV